MYNFSANSPLKRLIAYSTAIANRSELLYVILLSVVSLALSAAVEYCLAQLHIHQPERVDFLSHGMIAFFVMVVVFGPPFETLLFQHMPILLARRFGMPVVLQFAMGTIPFAVTHFQVGVVTGAAAGVVGGVIFSLAYLTFVSESKAKAFAITTAVHSLHNVVPFLMYAYDLP